MPKRHNFTSLQKQQILERDGYICAYCGGYGDAVDHILPASRGGEASLDNGVATCQSCNGKKHDGLDMVLLARGFFVVLANTANKVRRFNHHARPSERRYVQNHEILQLRRSGLTLEAIGQRYGVSRQRVHQIISKLNQDSKGEDDSHA